APAEPLDAVGADQLRGAVAEGRLGNPAKRGLGVVPDEVKPLRPGLARVRLHQRPIVPTRHPGQEVNQSLYTTLTDSEGLEDADFDSTCPRSVPLAQED